MSELEMMTTRMNTIHYWVDGRTVCGKELKGRQYHFSRIRRPNEKICERCIRKWVKLNAPATARADAARRESE